MLNSKNFNDTEIKHFVWNVHVLISHCENLFRNEIIYRT